MSEQWPLVYVLLVNWNAGKYTLACLSSLQAAHYPNYKVIVLDNASSDGSPAAIRAAYPATPIVHLPGNLGFTGANNAGFRYALERGANFVYLLNTDTRVDARFLDEAVKIALASPSIGVVGSKVRHAHRPDRLQFMGGRVNLTTGYNGRSFGYNQIDRGQHDHISDVDWVTGCALMVSAHCLEVTSGFDDAFFAFHEDVDLCLRARAAGFRVVMSPQSMVWHEGGGSMGDAVSPQHIYYDVRNHLRLVQKHKPAPNAAADLFRAGCIVGAHLAQVVMQRPSAATVRALWSGVRDHRCSHNTSESAGHLDAQ